MDAARPVHNQELLFDHFAGTAKTALRYGLGYYPAIADLHHTVSETRCTRIVRDHHHGYPVAVAYVLKGLEHLIRRPCVKLSGRLIGEHHARLIGKGNGNGNPLLLPSGQLVREPERLFPQAKGCEEGS